MAAHLREERVVVDGGDGGLAQPVTVERVRPVQVGDLHRLPWRRWRRALTGGALGRM